jgi:hypothetical protein
MNHHSNTFFILPDRSSNATVNESYSSSGTRRGYFGTADSEGFDENVWLKGDRINADLR